MATGIKTEVISLSTLPGLTLSNCFKIAKIAHEKGINLIHTHNEKAQFYGSFAGLLAGVPVVHTKHGKNELDWRSRLRNSIAAKFCKKIVAVSHDAAAECIQDEHIPAAKVMTILNGIDTERFVRIADQAAIKNSLGLTPDVPIIGIVARLAHVKDHATLLEACKLLADNGRPFRLLVVGDGPLRGNLEKLAVSRSIHDLVLFTGSRNDIPELMNVMDIFVLSSISEGISLTLIEAMACELPVVATAVGGNPEVVVDGETGFIVPPKNPEALAERLLLLMANAELQKQFGKNGRQRVVNHFSLSTAAKHYTELYRSVLS
jgi:glycosyltransferase involved in cell wall biosynthesis